MAKKRGANPVPAKRADFFGKLLESAGRPEFPSEFALAATLVFAANFLTFNFAPAYSVLAAVLAFFAPGYVLLDVFLPKDALDGFVERFMMALTLSICFTVLYVSIVNLWLSAPINRTVLGYLLISLNVGISGARLAYLRLQK